MDSISDDSLDFVNLNQSKNNADNLIVNNEVVIEVAHTTDIYSMKRKYDEIVDDYSSSSSCSNGSGGSNKEIILNKALKLFNECRDFIINDNENIIVQTVSCKSMCLTNKQLTKCRDCYFNRSSEEEFENCRFIGWRK